MTHTYTFTTNPTGRTATELLNEATKAAQAAHGGGEWVPEYIDFWHDDTNTSQIRLRRINGGDQ